MSITLKDLSPGCIVLIAGFDDIPEHEFRVEEIYEEFRHRHGSLWSLCRGIRRTRQRDDCETHLSRNNSKEISSLLQGRA
jgi:hypothetical protein